MENGADYVAEYYPWTSAVWYWTGARRFNTKIDKEGYTYTEGSPILIEMIETHYDPDAMARTQQQRLLQLLWLRFINENELYLSYNKYTGPERFDSTEVGEIIRFR